MNEVILFIDGENFLHIHKETEKKSIKLILFQRYLKANLEKQGFDFLIAGNKG